MEVGTSELKLTNNGVIGLRQQQRSAGVSAAGVALGGVGAQHAGSHLPLAVPRTRTLLVSPDLDFCLLGMVTSFRLVEINMVDSNYLGVLTYYNLGSYVTYYLNS